MTANAMRTDMLCSGMGVPTPRVNTSNLRRRRKGACSEQTHQQDSQAANSIGIGCVAQPGYLNPPHIVGIARFAN